MSREMRLKNSRLVRVKESVKFFPNGLTHGYVFRAGQLWLAVDNTIDYYVERGNQAIYMNKDDFETIFAEGWE